MSQFTRREFIGAAGRRGRPLTALDAWCDGQEIAHRCPTLFRARCLPKRRPGTLAGIKKIGYEGVEFAGYANQSAGDLRKMLDDNGLKACGSHVQGGLGGLQGDGLQREVDFNQTLGNDKLIIASLNATTADDWRRRADEFSAVAEKLEPFKMRVGYHNHTGEFPQT